MKESHITYKPIGIIYSGHADAEDTPSQPTYAKGFNGRAEIFPEYEEGLHDLDGFSHVYLIYHFHRAQSDKLTVKPPLQDTERGVFATREPSRPNAIGLSVVELLHRAGNILYLDRVDIFDRTPLLDIKPYISKWDQVETWSNGWLDEVDEETAGQRGERGYRY